MSVAVFNAWDYCPFVCSELTQSLSLCKTHTHHLPQTVTGILIKLTEAAKYTAAISWLTVKRTIHWGDESERVQGRKYTNKKRQIHWKKRRKSVGWRRREESLYKTLKCTIKERRWTLSSEMHLKLGMGNIMKNGKKCSGSRMKGMSEKCLPETFTLLCICEMGCNDAN